jgi:hypothetical protein
LKVRYCLSLFLFRPFLTAVQPLDWTSADSSIPYVQSRISQQASKLKADSRPADCPMVVLAADCTYSEDITVHLIHTIELLLINSHNAESHGLVISTIRHKDTFNFFLEQLGRSATLRFEDLSEWANGVLSSKGCLYHVSNRESIRTIKIVLR